jgi:hypothetical protein
MKKWYVALRTLWQHDSGPDEFPMCCGNKCLEHLPQPIAFQNPLRHDKVALRLVFPAGFTTNETRQLTIRASLARH